MRSVGSLVIATFIALQVFASDHIDGPGTTSFRLADLTDLFAFPTPGQPGFITIILNACPLVPEDGHFAADVNYAVILRRASIRDSGGKASFGTADEVSVTCTFETPLVIAEHTVSCRSSNGLTAQSRYEVVQDNRHGGDFRLYAGMRADPFFFNADFATDAIEGKLNPPDDDNVMRGVNILTIVMELDLRRLYESPPAMIAVAAETTARGSHPGAAALHFDRVGRPEITNVSLAARNDPDLRDRYNGDRPFQVPAVAQLLYREKLARNVGYYDKLDGRRDWPDRDRDELATLLAADFLVVDLSKPCPAQSFLEIEMAILRHKPHTTCGGRKPNDDIMDTLFTLYVAGMNGKPVKDGVDRPATPVSVRFPYLAAPDLTFWSTVRAWAARKVLGIPDVR